MFTLVRLGVIFCGLICLLGCESTQKPSHVQNSLCFRDDLEREICLSKPPKRVLSLAPSHTEWLFALNPDRIVGRTEHCNRPAEAAQVPNIGHLFPPDYERILATAPDLVLMLEGQTAIRDRLASLGLQVASFQPKSFASLWRFVRTLGKLLDREERAQSLIFQAQLELTVLKAKHLTLPKPSVFFIYWPEPLSTAGKDSFISAMIHAAGGQNIGDQLQGDWPKTSLEFLLQSDPDIILTTESQVFAQAKQSPSWAHLKAVQNDHLFLLEEPDLFLRPGPRMVEAVRNISSLIHR